MKRFYLPIIFSLSFPAFGVDLSEIAKMYAEGRYQTSSEKLELIYKDLYQNNKSDTKTRGLVSYWLGMNYNRIQDFDKSIKYFLKAIELDYRAPDLFYELAQAYFASEKLKEAKIYFNESFKNDFKIGTCLYYMAFISKELGEKDNAKSLYEVISKLPKDESKDVLQASELQIVDLKLEEVEKKSNAPFEIENQIIPDYERVISLGPESYLAPKIKEKIINLQKKYQLVLFQLRNGLPTLFPRHFLRVASEIGMDSNVVYAPTETSLTKSELSSPFSKTEMMGRYAFYLKDYLSLSPEMRLTYSRYFNRDENILKNDNLVIAPTIRSTFEHTLFNRPASLLLDYEFNQVERDINGENTLLFASRAHAFMLGERFQFFTKGPTTLRFKLRNFESYLDSSNSKTMSLIYEQTLNLKKGTLLIFSSLDHTKVNTEAFNSDAITLRGDYLFPGISGWNPSVGLALTASDPVNNRSERGLEKLINPGLRINRKIGKHWGANFRAEYYDNISKDKENFGYRKNLFGLEIDYIF
jgi:Tetratricopeptide repeat